MGRLNKSIGKTRMVILSKLTQLLIGLHENKEVLNLCLDDGITAGIIRARVLFGGGPYEEIRYLS